MDLNIVMIIAECLTQSKKGMTAIVICMKDRTPPGEHLTKHAVLV